ncbi:nucleotide sugar dehydrogenase [Salinicoccus halitifaciens]|uniref:UDP-glucose 6-dehydrogenase n=1 Tax=Salinicoccus halitifaciens TaxID=1073415 RepID=A0ABV2ECA1_9STAP|nr:nucleotide sugar dehydrogenase [Salinicoccus halitifaciens]MCD2138785.1 nucleotide sugar dehydrogenase [Salinicoccus halitifaciens]
MRITIIGLGYVGLSNAVLLAQNNEVIALDILEETVEKVNNKTSPINDKEIEFYLKYKDLNLKATTNYIEAIENSNYVIVCTPTNYDPDQNFFDTSTVEESIKKVLEINKEAYIIIKSTVPVGFTDDMKEQHSYNKIIFSPEFLREGKALYDNLNPARIIVGGEGHGAKQFSELLLQGAEKADIPVVFSNPTEAEAIKLFANTYLAMRISFFNELDSFSEIRGLDTKQIIEGVSLDPRIGNHYNNPSFGYGGYCLPKDTKQLLANYRDVPNNIMSAVVESNQTRKFHIADRIMKKNPKSVGIYRLTMKYNSDNFRESAIQSVIDTLLNNHIEVVIYEPLVEGNQYEGLKVIDDFETFTEYADIIIANRFSKELESVNEKVYTRDVFGRD